VPAWLPSLRNRHDDWRQMLSSLAEMYVRGVDIDWSGFDRDYGRRRVTTPAYPFTRKRFWIDPPKPRPAAEATSPSSAVHPLLGRQLELAGTKEVRFEALISETELATIKDHRIFDASVMPAAAYVEMALAAVARCRGRSGRYRGPD
jgi:acyl transferase domain-containing protein